MSLGFLIEKVQTIFPFMGMWDSYGGKASNQTLKTNEQQNVLIWISKSYYEPALKSTKPTQNKEIPQKTPRKILYLGEEWVQGWSLVTPNYTILN
jgi:hypothetical protein